MMKQLLFNYLFIIQCVSLRAYGGIKDIYDQGHEGGPESVTFIFFFKMVKLVCKLHF